MTPVPAPLPREYLAWEISKGDTELLAAANEMIAEMRQSGELQEMAQR